MLFFRRLKEPIFFIFEFLAVIEETKQNSDGSFVDSSYQHIYNDVSSPIEYISQPDDNIKITTSGRVIPTYKK